ncbi:MAG: sulfatase-like hydrolase/transferase, partial [Planctomycetota bacterium]
MNPDDAIPQPRPDRSVLMLIADDWSPIAGCYGDTLARTPNIDKFAESATVFDHAYCTSPSCAASRANLLTGLYSHTHGQYGHSHFPFGFTTHPHVQTLPAVLKAAGGFSGLGGKNHTAPRDLYPYDLFVGNGWLTDRIAQTTAESLRRGAGKPTFVMGASLFPHRAKIRDLDNDFYLPDDAWRPDLADVAVPDWLPDAPAVRDDLAAYYGAIERFDHFVGANLAALEASGRAEQTLVILLSDHGLPFPFAKASSFEAGLHCPLLIRRPGGQGQHTDALANWCDVTRTVYDWLGLTVPEGVWFEDRPKPEQPALPGRSLHPLLEPDADAADWHTTHFSHTCHETNNHYPFRGCINRHGNRRLKYVEHVVDPGTT